MKQGIHARECSCNHAAEKHVPTLDARFMRCTAVDEMWMNDRVPWLGPSSVVKAPCECVIVRKEVKA